MRKNWVREKLSHLSQVTQLVSDRGEHHTQALFSAMPMWHVIIKTKEIRIHGTEKVLHKMVDSFLPAINHVVECSIKVFPEQIFYSHSSS